MTTADAPVFPFDNTYARELEGFYVRVSPAPFPDPQLVLLNEPLATELGLDVGALRAEGAAWLSGSRMPDGADALAQAYAGHQFGGLSPQLGDGRALLLGEVLDVHGRRRDIHLKGSGRTPFSRRGDGLATLGPVLREYILGEAMHHLGIPTTRALAAVRTGAMVRREGLLPGAVLARVASSHIRVGTFQFFAIRDDEAKLRELVRYTLARHYPHLVDDAQPALVLLRAAIETQARLIAQWMLVGFIHGVMNTDNMTLSGETIDYGPCAFMDAYHPGTVFSSIDQHGRYAYGNQPGIGQWNLARLAEALLPLLHADEPRAIELAQEELAAYPEIYTRAWLHGMRRKLGLLSDETASAKGSDEEDGLLAQSFLELLAQQRVDFTNGFRALSTVLCGEAHEASHLYTDVEAFDAWCAGWLARVTRDGAVDAGARAARAASMDRANPLYIPRNHKVEEALTAAVRGDLGPTERLLDVLARPFEARRGLGEYAAPAPVAFTEDYQTFCGT
ncbi:MAG: YdiU family protein [Polyangiales bacterium]|nr:YdiU family protein [Myxococcales bacterium]MCB9656160.1 YdiU family protein [Sandaracinaceae bacterium]